MRRALGVVVTAAAFGVLTAAPALAASLPYTDTNATGHLGLCDGAGHAVQAGSLDDKPFLGTVVSSGPAPADYAGEGRTATLFAFQPRRGLAPGQWSGEALGASSRYTNADHPMAKLVAADAPLREFVNAYPPRWDGLVQLRVYLGAPNRPPFTQSYAATDIRVTGSRWEVVRGGDVACDSGQATSIAELLPSADPSKSLARSMQEQQAAHLPTAGASPGDGGPAASRLALPAVPAAPRSARHFRPLLFVVASLAAFALLVALLRRRRSRPVHLATR